MTDENDDKFSGPTFRLPELNFGGILPHPVEIPADLLRGPKDYNLASEFHSRLIKWINDFDQSLDNAHEVGVKLVSFGQSVIFHLKDIGYWNPSLISFSGETEGGEPVELIQHVSQISILLMKLPRKNPEAPKQPIGFSSEDERDGQPRD
ncbi:MAG TPA: DUF6173 family protein [Tepidisphaeraceae bacterium]|jgi:hypothetical protein|nr:DUF6173 family protein [Tepidisphaeraceae bacterium]